MSFVQIEPELFFIDQTLLKLCALEIKQQEELNQPCHWREEGSQVVNKQFNF